jgi:predicted transcriptional regulator
MDIQEHLNKLMKMRQELAGIGASLTEEDFTTIVVSSLPAFYNTVTTSLYTSARMSKQQVSMEDIYIPGVRFRLGVQSHKLVCLLSTPKVAKEGVKDLL